MKFLKIILPLVLTILVSSCTKNDIDETEIDETTTLNYVQTISNTTHDIEVFTVDKNLHQGYNAVFLRITDKASDSFVKDAQLSWNPVMHMMQMMHSCPTSEITKTEGTSTLYNGYIIFQMAENDTEKWTLTLDYTINNMSYTAESSISVPASDKKNITVFTGTDNVKYVLALMNPTKPKVGINDFKVGLFKMESMMSFPIVENYKITQDPRMPSMGNHSSPNNTNLVYNSSAKLYEGDLSLTMTGYWKLNLMLYNDLNQLLKGEEVTTTNEGSSLYLEIEF